MQNRAYPCPTPPKSPTSHTPHGPAPVPLVTPMDRYARFWICPCTNIGLRWRVLGLYSKSWTALRLRGAKFLGILTEVGSSIERFSVGVVS